MVPKPLPFAHGATNLFVASEYKKTVSQAGLWGTTMSYCREEGEIVIR